MAKRRIDRPEVEKKVIAAVKVGNTLKASALAAGISEATLRRWCSNDGFDSRLREAEAEAEVRYATLIQRAALTDWKAAAFWLERRRHADWRKVETREVSGPAGGPIPVALDAALLKAYGPADPDQGSDQGSGLAPAPDPSPLSLSDASPDADSGD